MNILDLPDELLLKIVDYATFSDTPYGSIRGIAKKIGLCDIRRVCKKLFRIGNDWSLWRECQAELEFHGPYNEHWVNIGNVKYIWEYDDEFHIKWISYEKIFELRNLHIDKIKTDCNAFRNSDLVVSKRRFYEVLKQMVEFQGDIPRGYLAAIASYLSGESKQGKCYKHVTKDSCECTCKSMMLLTKAYEKIGKMISICNADD